MTTSTTATTTPWRPQVLWFPMGGLLGALAGAATGVATLVVVAALSVTSDGVGTIVADLVFVVFIGALFGAMAGAVVGLFVGVELMFLVGAHLPRDVARRRAYRLGFVLPPATMLAGLLLLGNGEVSPAAGAFWGAMPLVGASLFGGPFARWLAGFQPPRPDTVS